MTKQERLMTLADKVFKETGSMRLPGPEEQGESDPKGS